MKTKRSLCLGVIYFSLVVSTPGADTITFVSDTTWDVRDASNHPVGQAQRVGLNPTIPPTSPPGTTDYVFGGTGWPADLSSIPEATWIWAPGITGQSPRANLATYSFTKSFALDAPPAS